MVEAELAMLVPFFLNQKVELWLLLSELAN